MAKKVITYDYECPVCKTYIFGKRRFAQHIIDAHDIPKRESRQEK